MKTLLKMAIAIALITASVQAGRAVFTDYQFEDAVHQQLLFADQTTDQELQEMALDVAAGYGLPLSADDVAVRRVGQDLVIDMTYTRDVVLLPGIYTRAWTFTPSASIRLLRPRRD